ncbi:MAG TPA: hypothetical protein VHT91_00220 [Kofleriaceae bacterium]|jgi:hypothetical protein|nr:hypothetical protein [Kofleriaceae bacterium]
MQRSTLFYPRNQALDDSLGSSDAAYDRAKPLTLRHVQGECTSPEMEVLVFLEFVRAYAKYVADIADEVAFSDRDPRVVRVLEVSKAIDFGDALTQDCDRGLRVRLNQR